MRDRVRQVVGAAPERALGGRQGGEDALLREAPGVSRGWRRLATKAIASTEPPSRRTGSQRATWTAVDISRCQTRSSSLSLRSGAMRRRTRPRRGRGPAGGPGSPRCRGRARSRRRSAGGSRAGCRAATRRSRSADSRSASRRRRARRLAKGRARRGGRGGRRRGPPGSGARATAPAPGSCGGPRPRAAPRGSASARCRPHSRETRREETGGRGGPRTETSAGIACHGGGCRRGLRRAERLQLVGKRRLLPGPRERC